MLHIKIFTLRFSDATEGFDDDSIRAFMADKEIVSLKEQFFFKDTVPYWSTWWCISPAFGQRWQKRNTGPTGTEELRNTAAFSLKRAPRCLTCSDSGAMSEPKKMSLLPISCLQ